MVTPWREINKQRNTKDSIVRYSLAGLGAVALIGLGTFIYGCKEETPKVPTKAPIAQVQKAAPTQVPVAPAPKAGSLEARVGIPFCLEWDGDINTKETLRYFPEENIDNGGTFYLEKGKQLEKVGTAFEVVKGIMQNNDDYKGSPNEIRSLLNSVNANGGVPIKYTNPQNLGIIGPVDDFISSDYMLRPKVQEQLKK